MTRDKLMRVDSDFFNMVKRDKKKQKELLGLDLSDREITKMYAKKLMNKRRVIEL